MLTIAHVRYKSRRATAMTRHMQWLKATLLWVPAVKRIVPNAYTLEDLA
jgi:hypothetical protein